MHSSVYTVPPECGTVQALTYWHVTLGKFKPVFSVEKKAPITYL